MFINKITIEKSFTLSLDQGYRKVSVTAEASVTEDNEDPKEVYNKLSDFITDRMKEEKEKFTKK